MKMKILLSALLMLFTIQHSFGQADYTLSSIGSQMKEVCQSGSSTSITVQAVITDDGSNGDATDYLWFAPGGGLSVSGTITGSVPNGTTEIVGVTVTATGTLGATYILRCRATHNSGMNPIDLDFQITINDVPTPTTIGTPDGTESCDGIKIELAAQLPAGVTASYSWNTGETTSSIFTNTAGSYLVVTSNACGTANASQAITAEVTPNLSTTACSNNGATDQLTFTVSATDNDNAGITFTFHEGDPANPALVNGGDYSITTGATTATLVVSHVHTNHQATNFYAKATNSCGTATSTACLALPIELEYFKGHYTGRAVALDWATATETNNDYFSIERSLDGLNFKEIARMEGAGTSYFTLKYSYTDEEALLYQQAGTLYYRLKQTDYDGSFSYSDMIAVRLGEVQNFAIENLSLSSGADLQFSLQSAQPGEAQLSVYRIDGSRVIAQPLALQKGMQEYRISLPKEISAGLYLLRIESGAQMAFKKFVVNR